MFEFLKRVVYSVKFGAKSVVFYPSDDYEQGIVDAGSFVLTGCQKEGVCEDFAWGRAMSKGMIGGRLATSTVYSIQFSRVVGPLSTAPRVHGCVPPLAFYVPYSPPGSPPQSGASSTPYDSQGLLVLRDPVTLSYYVSLVVDTKVGIVAAGTELDGRALVFRSGHSKRLLRATMGLLAHNRGMSTKLKVVEEE